MKIIRIAEVLMKSFLMFNLDGAAHDSDQMSSNNHRNLCVLSHTKSEWDVYLMLFVIFCIYNITPKN